MGCDFIIVVLSFFFECATIIYYYGRCYCYSVLFRSPFSSSLAFQIVLLTSVCVCVPKMNDAKSATSLCYWLNGPVEPNKGTNAFEPTHTLIPTLPLYLLLERKEQHIRTEHTDAWFVSLSLSFLIQMGKEKCSIYLFFFCLSTIYFLLWLAWFTTLSYCSG